MNLKPGFRIKMQIKAILIKKETKDNNNETDLEEKKLKIISLKVLKKEIKKIKKN